MRRTSIKHGVWHLDGRKRQKGGFLPIVGTLAKPLLVSTAGAIGGEVLIGIGKNNIWGENAVEKKEEKDIDICLGTKFCFQDFQICGAYSSQTAAYFLQNTKESIDT